MIRSGFIPSASEVSRTAEITLRDIADAKRIGSQRAPRMAQAFGAILIDPKEDPGPIPDPTPE